MIIKKIKTDNNFYFYEPFSNNFYQVNKNIYNADLKKINSEERKIFQEKIPESYNYSGLKKIKQKISFNRMVEILKNEIQRLVLFVSDTCNNKCGYCFYSEAYQNSKKLSNKLMSFDIAKKAIDFYFLHSKRSELDEYSVGFYGGEPLLNYEVIKESINYIKKEYRELEKKLIFSLSSNLTLLTDEMLDFFIENDMYISVSLDGPKELHDRYRIFKNGEGTFDVVYNNLKKIEVRSEVYLKNNIMLSIVAAPPIDLVSIYDFYKNDSLISKIPIARIGTISNIDEPRFKDIYGYEMDDGIDTENVSFEKYKNETIEKGLSNCSFLSNLYHRSFWKIHNRNMNFLKLVFNENNACIPGQMRLLVDINGDFRPCEKGIEYNIGNIHKGFDYKKCYDLIVNFAKLRTEICRDCWAVRFCGNCYLSALMNGKLNKKAFKNYCENYTKPSIELNLKRYLEIMEINPKAFEKFRERIIWKDYFLL